MASPIPKRSEDRRRRNKPAVPIRKAQAGAVVIPDAAPDWHPLAVTWFEALKASGQSRFYEQSDWAEAAVAAEILTRGLAKEDGNKEFAQFQRTSRDLLATEAARRAAHVELQREGAENVSASADVIKAVFGGIAEPAS